jgi:hypothetical protein
VPIHWSDEQGWREALHAHHLHRTA